MEIIDLKCLEEALTKGAGELFNAGVPDKVYRKHEGIAQSDLKTLTSYSPRHYMMNRFYAEYRKQTPALLLGEAMHTAFFEPDKFDKGFVIAPKINRRTKAGKEEYAEYIESNKDKKILTDDQKNSIDRMMERIKDTPELQEYITGGQVERCFFTPPMDPYAERIPVSLKIRTDYWIEDRNMIVDLKTTLCAAQGPFLQSILKYGYYIQDAYYTDVISHFREEPRFIFIVVEKVQPYDIAIYELDPAYKKQGRNVYREGLRQMAHCFENDDWPGYQKRVKILECPEWTKRQWKAKLLESLEE